MQTTQAVCGSVIWLGRRGENEARAITFDLTDWQAEYGNGTVQGLAKRVYDYYAYPVALTVDGATATWTITDADVAQAGQYGSFELRYYVGDVLVKSAIWKTAVDQSIGEIIDAPTAPEQAWGETIIQAGADAQAAAEAAAASAAEIVGMTADATTLAAGEAATVTKTIQSGVVNLSFGIPRGADGAQGAQGEKGDTGETGPAGPAGPNNLFIAVYGETSAAEIWDAYSAGKWVVAYDAGNAWYGAAVSINTTNAQFSAILDAQTIEIATVNGTTWNYTDTKLAVNASPTFTGTPKAPTAAVGTNTTQIATTAFVQAAITAAIPPSAEGVSF